MAWPVHGILGLHGQRSTFSPRKQTRPTFPWLLLQSHASHMSPAVHPQVKPHSSLWPLPPSIYGHAIEAVEILGIKNSLEKLFCPSCIRWGTQTPSLIWFPNTHMFEGWVYPSPLWVFWREREQEVWGGAQRLSCWELFPHVFWRYCRLPWNPCLPSVSSFRHLFFHQLLSASRPDHVSLCCQNPHRHQYYLDQPWCI